MSEIYSNSMKIKQELQGERIFHISNLHESSSYAYIILKIYDAP